MSNKKLPLGSKVIASNWDMFVETPDVEGILSHYDDKGRPHILSKNQAEINAYGPTRAFDTVRLTLTGLAEQNEHELSELRQRNQDLEDAITYIAFYVGMSDYNKPICNIEAYRNKVIDCINIVEDIAKNKLDNC